MDDSSKVAVCEARPAGRFRFGCVGPRLFVEVDPFQLTGGGSASSKIGRGLHSAVLDGAVLRSDECRRSAIGRIGQQRDRAGFARVLLRQNLAAAAVQAGGQPLPLAGRRGDDDHGFERHAVNAPLLYVSPGQINFLLPDNVAPGAASVHRWGQQPARGSAAGRPALFSMSSTGTGVAAALAVAVQASNPELQSPVPVFQCGSSGCASVPLVLSTDRPVYLSLYGTGIRNRSSLTNVSVSIAGVNVPALYAGPASGFAGLDQVNVALPLSLQGAGESDVFIRVDGQTSNIVTISVH